MSMYKYMREAWKRPKESLGDIWKQRLIKWRREQTTVRIEKPTRIDRARSLGYKAKQGVIVVRQRVLRGGHTRPKIRHGRRPKHFGHNKVLGKSYQQICEERASKKYVNCEVLNSYYVAEDGKYLWYEIILLDRAHPAIIKDKNFSAVAKKRGRPQRGLTSAGRKSRALTKKGKGVEKARPSSRARGRKIN